MRKISTTVQLPKDLLDALNEVKGETRISKNIIIEKSLRAFFENRVLDLPEDLMDRLRGIEEQYGSSYNFVIEKALRIFFAEDIEMAQKTLKEEKED